MNPYKFLVPLQFFRRKEVKKMELYDLYQNGKFLKRGTLQELSEYTTLSRSTLKNYSLPSYHKKRDDSNSTKLYKVKQNA